jgi:hypothetical protein
MTTRRPIQICDPPPIRNAMASAGAICAYSTSSHPVTLDVDQTIVAYDGSPRPLVPETFARLVAEGHQVYLWSEADAGLERVYEAIRKAVTTRADDL